jgi:DNA helicase-2/ATP-dependent DNA helicase PcrA
VAKVDVMREQTQGQTLRQIIQTVLDGSGLLAHYRAEREGADRVENLEELINAAESFVTLEGFGRDAVALPTDELASSDRSQRDGRPGPGLGPARALSQSPASQGLDFEDALADANERAQQAQYAAADDDLPLWADLPTERPASLAAGVPAELLLAVLPEDTGETLSPLAAFLTHAALEAGDNQAQAGQDAVQLMTVHAAKGLEFDCVFITGLEEGLFPHENSASDRAGLEEERRLMYVAITRARKRLYISHSQTRMLHGQTRYNLRSRFLDELPEACLRWLTPKGGGFGQGMGVGLARGAAGGGWGGRSAPSFSGANNAYASSAGGGIYSKNKDAVFTGAVPGPALEPKSGRGTDIAVGQKVFHNKFGEGKVLTLEGAGADARAQINFPRHGVKWLALAVAKLTPVDD